MAESRKTPMPWWQPTLFCALAGGMAWGIRGQYGHETGAMIAGLLVSSTIVFLLCPRGPALPIVRAIAIGTVAMGFGGSMTYGQTVGLTHDAPLVGNWDALRWGFFGLAIKGGLWIGLAGVFLGMGLSEKRYRPVEMLLLMLGMIAMALLGGYLLNTPMNPEERQLPYFYFSDHWHWEPNTELKHRPEFWGALAFALLTATIYTGFIRGDKLARNLALWGLLGGALGFPAGQSLQAFHAWNPEMFRDGFLASVTAYFNWWNVMETIFGAVMGAVLGLGAWFNRERIAPAGSEVSPYVPLPVELALLAVHIPMLVLVEFAAIPAVDFFYDIGIVMGVIPMVLIVGGRFFPWLQIFPLILLPIAGKTVRALVYQGDTPHLLGWAVYFLLPMGFAFALALWPIRKSDTPEQCHAFVSRALLFNVWCYFYLNYAFFNYPFPWSEWTGRTPNGLVFTACAIGLTAMVALSLRALQPKA